MAKFYNSFSVDMEKWVEKAKGRTGAFLREFSQDMALEIIRATKVKTGFARASWYGTVSNITTYEPAPVGYDETLKKPTYPKDPMDTMNKFVMAITTAQAGDIVYVLNNCSYINVLEDGFGNRPAYNMVKSAVSKADVIADEVLRRIGAD